MSKIEIDFITVDTTDTFSLIELLTSFPDLVLESYERVGPGGGNPCMVLSGSKEKLTELLVELYPDESFTADDRDIHFIE